MEVQSKLTELDERMRAIERVVERLKGGVILGGFIFAFVVAIIVALGNAHLEAIWVRGIDANKKTMDDDRMIFKQTLADDRKTFQELNQKNLGMALEAIGNIAARQSEAMRELFSSNTHRDEKVGQLMEMVVRQETNFEVFKRHVERMERLEMLLGELRSDTVHMRKELDRWRRSSGDAE